MTKRCAPAAMAALGVSGRLVGPAAFKAVEGSFTRLLVGSIPIHLRFERPLETERVSR